MKNHYTVPLILLLMVCFVFQTRMYSSEIGKNDSKKSKHVLTLAPNIVILPNAPCNNKIPDNGFRGTNAYGDNIYAYEFYTFNIVAFNPEAITPFEKGNIFVIFTQSGLCTGMIFYFYRSVELILNSNIRIYPNPSQGIFHLEDIIGHAEISMAKSYFEVLNLNKFNNF